MGSYFSGLATSWKMLSFNRLTEISISHGSTCLDSLSLACDVANLIIVSRVLTVMGTLILA